MTAKIYKMQEKHLIPITQISVLKWNISNKFIHEKNAEIMTEDNEYNWKIIKSKCFKNMYCTGGL